MLSGFRLRRHWLVLPAPSSPPPLRPGLPLGALLDLLFLRRPKRMRPDELLPPGAKPRPLPRGLARKAEVLECVREPRPAQKIPGVFAFPLLEPLLVPIHVAHGQPDLLRDLHNPGLIRKGLGNRPGHGIEGRCAPCFVLSCLFLDVLSEHQAEQDMRLHLSSRLYACIHPFERLADPCMRKPVNLRVHPLVQTGKYHSEEP